MIDIKAKEECCGCQACAQICPKSCVTMQPDEEGFLYPIVDTTACIQCGLCERVCPELHSTRSGEIAPIAYAAYNRDEKTRMESSSGGVFTLLAEQVLNQNGVIYGVAMEHSYVLHIRVDQKDGLKQLRGSKYVQSDTSGIYLQVKRDLDDRHLVLFTGTPCQIEGLKGFLRREYENLICMDFICHGVPAPKVWEKYVSLREKTSGARIERVNFRHKKYGWEMFSMMIHFENKTAYHSKRKNDLYMRTFMSDICLRPSCYHCSFKKRSRVADITVADFWGIDEACPDMNDEKGISMVVLHSRKGERLFELISKDMIWRKVDVESAICSNLAMIRSSKMPENRQEFMKRIQTEPIEDLVPQFTRKPINLKAEVKSFVKVAMYRIGLLSLAKKMKRHIRNNCGFNKCN